MDIEEAKELLREMQENCKSKTIYKDEKAEAKAEAIGVVLKELDEKDELLHNTVEYNAVKQKEWILKDIKKERVIDEMAQYIADGPKHYPKDSVKKYFYKKVGG